jgi:hypothetical protein
MPYEIPKNKKEAPEISDIGMKKIKSAAGDTKVNTLRKFAHIFNYYFKKAGEGRAWSAALGSIKKDKQK